VIYQRSTALNQMVQLPPCPEGWRAVVSCCEGSLVWQARVGGSNPPCSTLFELDFEPEEGLAGLLGGGNVATM
jgi:hypothetical protein